MMTKEQLDSRHPIDLSTEVLSRYPNGGTLTVYNSIDRSTGDFHRILRCAEFFAKCQIPFVKAEKLPAIGRTSDKKKKLRLVRSTIRRGYLIHCTLEAHDGELMAALAKRIVKDQCPSCGASIVGAVDENYVCSYCGNMIMGVIEKKW